MLCCIQGHNVTLIKLICKSMIYADELKFSVQSPNYAAVLVEIVYFSSRDWRHAVHTDMTPVITSQSLMLYIPNDRES